MFFQLGDLVSGLCCVFLLGLCELFPESADSGKTHVGFASGGEGIVQMRLPSGEFAEGESIKRCWISAALDPVRVFDP